MPNSDMLRQPNLSRQNFRVTLDAVAILANFRVNLTSLIRIRRQLILMPMSNLSRRLEKATERSHKAQQRIMTAEHSVARTLIDLVRGEHGGSHHTKDRPIKNVTPRKS